MPVTLEVEAGVATITMDIAGRKNALSNDLMGEVGARFLDVQEDTDVRAVILTGGGDDFCAGADIKSANADTSISASLKRMTVLARMIRGITLSDKPVIAAVRGVAVGVGWSLALACDYVIVAEDARFQFAFRHIGLGPDGGAVKLLMQNMGILKARQLIYSGRFVTGTEAGELGLASEVLPAADVLPRARELASELASAPTLSIAMAKRQFAVAQNQTLEEALNNECVMQALMTRSDDYLEGTTAFREKRKPVYKGA
jgi:2-(1,2-epoxy-1,2-dihydrophenyl)acetyl-CoA isomerase